MGTPIVRPEPSESASDALDEPGELSDDDSFGDFTASPPESGTTLTAIGRLKMRSVLPPAEVRRIESAPRSRSMADALAAVKLPPPESIPVLTRSSSSLVELPLDPRAAFLASQIDGSTTIECLLDLGTMPRAAMLEALVSLVALGVVVFG